MKPIIPVPDQPPVPGWARTTTDARVVIPAADGSKVAEIITVKVKAWKDPKTGETYLDGHAIEELDRIKARRLGILTPEELRDLRRSLGLTQKELSGLLQIGEKSWTRWETGRERPSRSMNVLLRALKDGRIDARYLCALRTPRTPALADYDSDLRLAPALAVHESAPPAVAAPEPGPRKPARRVRVAKSRG